MEHGLILLIEAILAIDRNLQKPVRAVVPNLARLRADPRAVLADEETVFGPRRAYAVSTVFGILVAAATLIGFTVAALDRPKNQRVGMEYVFAAGIGVLASGAATFALSLRWLRGGAAVLRPEGVEFVYRGRTAFCPWGLFQAAGAPYQPDHKRIILPANDGTPVALTDAAGNVSARPAADVRTKSVSGCAAGQVALADLYEVKLGELGELLLHLGRQLGDGSADAADGFAAAEAGGPATAEADGWFRVRLTRLPFPPVCLGCGQYTTDAIPHALDVAQKVHINLPLCRSCQAERQARRQRAVLLGVAAGIGPAAFALAAASPFLAADGLIILGLLLVPAGMVIGLVTGMVARGRAEPARFKEYSAGAGTVAMRVPPTAGDRAFRRALGLAEEPAEVA